MSIVSTPSLVPIRNEADDIFLTAQTGSFDTDLKNNAPLDLESIKTLALATLDPKLEIHVTGTGVHRRFVSVEYHIAGPLLPVDGISMEIYNCAGASIAQSMMRTYLGRIENDVSKMFRKPEKPLGQVALKSDIDVIWVRNAVHVRVWLVRGEGTRAEAFSFMKLMTKNFTSSHFLAENALSDTSSPMNKILSMADALDKHLVAGAVSPSLYRTPDTTMDKTHLVVRGGEIFSFKLLNVANTLKLKPSIPEDGSIVSPQNNGSVEGVYTFGGKKIGKTKLCMYVARSDNLSVGWAEVEVEIVDPKADLEG